MQMSTVTFLRMRFELEKVYVSVQWVVLRAEVHDVDLSKLVGRARGTDFAEKVRGDSQRDAGTVWKGGGNRVRLETVQEVRGRPCV